MRTRKLSLRDEEDSDESSMSSRTRPRLQIETIEFGIHLPPPPLPLSPPLLNENQDLNFHPDLAMCGYLIKPKQAQPPPPPPLSRNQDLNIHKRMCDYFQPPEQPPPQPLSIHIPQPPPPPPPPRTTRRQRRNPTHAPRLGKPQTIQPPFSWATDRRGQVHNLKYLIEKGITTISGDVQCKRCEQSYQIEYDLVQKFSEVSRYVWENKYSFRDRAPACWMNPTLPKCRYCHQENSVKPKMAESKKSVNWLFLLLGQMLGCCTLDQLKYFCKHTGHHRTGAKDRVLFLTYLGLCKQVNPDGPFDRCN
ncbi:hypothetical protein LXL04_000656 [Taraxacum kok-saghyz]